MAGLKHPLLARLSAGDVLISDGATGTYLQQHGLTPGGCPEELNLSHPGVVRGMAAAYFAAGSDMVLTNSFGGNVFRLRHYDLADRAAQINLLAASLARSGAPLGRFVIGSVGPTGELLEPLGDVSAEAVRDAFAEQAVALEAGGVDGILVETMSALDEATLAVRSAREHVTGVVMATMTFHRGVRGWATSMGVTPERAIKALGDAGAEVVGANCGVGAGRMVELARILRDLTDGPLLIHANAGLPEVHDGRIVYPETPEVMAPHFAEMRRIGIDILGGCCGTGPAHIRAIVHAVRGGPGDPATPRGEEGY
ncbi:MAG TPA: homocysteine S-methyltransferase family protein [bacterium]|nr:homocysteine S-methyltransferase family protein [bacterium]